MKYNLGKKETSELGSAIKEILNIEEKYGIYDDDGNKYGGTFSIYEDAECYMKEHKNVGLIPEDCDVVDEINWE